MCRTENRGYLGTGCISLEAMIRLEAVISAPGIMSAGLRRSTASETGAMRVLSTAGCRDRSTPGERVYVRPGRTEGTGWEILPVL